MPKAKNIKKLIPLFIDAMGERFDAKEEAGWEGWNSKKLMLDSHNPIKERIIQNVLDGDWVDVANLAMFAWNLEEG